MKTSNDRAPLNWSRNPSLFSSRARGSALAVLGALTCLFIDVSPWLAAAFIGTGVLFLCGPNDRWRSTPWLTFTTMLVTVATLVFCLYIGIFKPAFTSTSDPVGWALAFASAVTAGLASDEWMASAQTLRRLGFHRRHIVRSFFGNAPRRRT